MATILKIPDDTKGVAVFTTQERDNIILKSSQYHSQLDEIRKTYLTGIHYNYIGPGDPHTGSNPRFFDFAMCDPGDGRNPGIPMIPLDAINFVPEYFVSDNRPEDKCWDILYVCRAADFKRVDMFIKDMRKIFDRGHSYRAVLISSSFDRKTTDTLLESKLG